MISDEIPRLLLDRTFSDMDQYGREVGWDLGFRQLDAGRLRARAAVVATSRCAAMRVELDRAMHQAGNPPTGLLTFGLPDREVGEFNWCAAKASGGDVLNFNHAGGFEGVSGPGFSGFTLSFREDLLQETLEVLDLDLDLRSLVSRCVGWIDPRDVANRLRWQLTDAYDAFTSARDCDEPRFAELFALDAAALILQLVAGNQGRKAPPSLPARRRAVRTALEWLQEHDHLPLTVSELCRRAGVSAPSLYRGFLEELGVGPKKYLQIRRLAAVRQELRSIGSEACIANVANRWGFWHMGQFAADYRRHFGELPSETLLSATGGCAASPGRP